MGEHNPNRNYKVYVVDGSAYSVDVAREFFAVRRFPVGQVKAVLYVYHLIQLKKVYVNLVLFVRKGRSIQHKGVTVDHLICGYNGRAPACADDFCPALNITFSLPVAGSIFDHGYDS